MSEEGTPFRLLSTCWKQKSHQIKWIQFKNVVQISKAHLENAVVSLRHVDDVWDTGWVTLATTKRPASVGDFVDGGAELPMMNGLDDSKVVVVSIAGESGDGRSREAEKKEKAEHFQA
ncbi:hypothetical protein B9Z55_024875 [Caenorhabditis nigoni]|uniref:Uncharacterized protein n=1 Tax=Caenorhabditis nigoni TaxID=1611254 RepID=A0A2G5SVV9_9PELO|nr:hypothetical protein B9Z55_024875 [Caenorhabditis nigoni]